MNLKKMFCLIGLHDYKKTKIDKRICKVCGKIQVGRSNFASDLDGNEIIWE